MILLIAISLNALPLYKNEQLFSYEPFEPYEPFGRDINVKVDL